MNATYVHPFTDFGFKKLFGEENSKPLLLSFLNDLLALQSPIASLTFSNPERFPNHVAARKSVYDIYCTDAKGQKFIVELQKIRQDFFKDRTVYYSTFPIQEQAQKGEWNFELTAVYCVGILGFVFAEDEASPDYIHTVKLKDGYNQIFYDKLTYIYVEMPKFEKTLDQLSTHLDRWLYFIKNLSDLSEIPALFQNDIIEHGFEVAALAAMTPKERAQYEQSLKEYRDNVNTMNTAKREARAEGLAEGMQKGEATLLISLLEHRFGEIPARYRDAIAQADAETLLHWGTQVLDAKNLDDIIQLSCKTLAPTPSRE